MLRSFGVAVCGPGSGEIMELDKLHFHNSLVTAGLPVADMHLCTGLDELQEYSEKHKGSFFAKLRDHYRDDWETTCIDGPDDCANLIAEKRKKVGAKRAAEMELLCYEPIESKCEGGIDGFRLRGAMANLISCGYECKDCGYVTKIMDSIPEIFKAELKGIAPEYENSDYAAPWSNESRITEDGKAHPIDQTCRCGEPPTAVFCELLGESYAIAVFQLARGIMPVLKKIALYGAQVNISSPWHKDNELLVTFPPDIEQWVKLENSVCRDGKFYCIPNDNDGGFGMVVAIGNSVEEVTKLAMDRVQMVNARGMEYKPDCFGEIMESIEVGRTFGINF